MSFYFVSQTLVDEVHRRVLVEYIRAIMRGRIMCTSSKMRKRMAFRMQEEAKQLKGLFKDLVRLYSCPPLLLGLVQKNQRHSHCKSRQTLELPESGITQTMLIQRALKNGILH